MKELLISSAKSIGINVLNETADLFLEYRRLLLEWNTKMNLTAITDDKEIILKHFVDSISILTGFSIADDAKIIDIGTGAGFPGIPIKLVKPSCEMTLMDSLNKRINFLNHVCETLELKNISCIHMRAEDAGNDKLYREKFDLCVSRAVANMAALSEYCLPLVKVGGHFIAQKGPNAKDELLQAEKAISALGGKVFLIKTIEIPNSDIIHNVIVVKKVRHTPSQYPRKAAGISKYPIM